MSSVPSEYTSRGDPQRTIALLWEDPAAQPRLRGRGPRPRLDVATVRAAAIELADRDGLAAVTMRNLATALGLGSAMALYTYVPGKAELVDVMVDACFAEFTLDPSGTEPRPAARIRAIADANRAVYEGHAWLAEVSVDRPPLGPGQLHKYELELRALEGLGLSDREMDLTLGLVGAFVRAHAASATTAASSSEEAAWWAVAGPALAQHARPQDFPLASRVGSAAGEQQGRALDPDAAYAFGTERIAAGIQALRDSKNASVVAKPNERPST